MLNQSQPRCHESHQPREEYRADAEEYTCQIQGGGRIIRVKIGNESVGSTHGGGATQAERNEKRGQHRIAGGIGDSNQRRSTKKEAPNQDGLLAEAIYQRPGQKHHGDLGKIEKAEKCATARQIEVQAGAQLRKSGAKERGHHSKRE